MRHQMDCPVCLGRMDLNEMYIVADEFNLTGPAPNAVYAVRCAACLEEGEIHPTDDGVTGPLGDFVDHVAPTPRETS